MAAEVNCRDGAAKPIVGWREWVALPALGIDAIKTKVDTGARTSALHTFSIEASTDRGVKMVRFGVHPVQHDRATEIWCQTPLRDERSVRDSGGHKEWRFVIETPLRMGQNEWPMELTLTDRDTMLFRMIVGRTALAGLCVDPSISFASGMPPPG